MGRVLWLVVMAAVVSAGVSVAQDLPRGQVLASVTTLDDPAQGYALYLPSAYTTDRAWPILIGFHPAARGGAIIDTYRDAAERHGFIVAASNTSRNGSWEASWRAATTMMQDVARRLAIDGRRVYLTGHSGGSRLALQLALATPQVAGVIASSAGYADVTPRASVPFAIFATAGVEDFNYLEMRRLAGALKTPHRLAVFPGGHTLPPQDVALQAIEWLDLQAMASGRRSRDDALIERLWSARAATIAAAGETSDAVLLLRAMADDFRAFRDVKALEARAADLSRRKDIRRALDRDRDADEKEGRLRDEFDRREAALRDPALRLESLRDLATMLADLHTEATVSTDSPERARARRVLRGILVGAGEGVRDDAYVALLRPYRPTAPDRP